MTTFKYIERAKIVEAHGFPDGGIYNGAKVPENCWIVFFSGGKHSILTDAEFRRDFEALP